MDPAVRLRLIGAYACLVGSHAGVAYISAVMSELGMRPPEIALLLLVNSVFATFGGPAWADHADRHARRAPALREAALGSAVVATGLLLVDHRLAWAALIAVFGLVRGAVGPLIDGTTVDLLGAERHRYARLRVAGSIGFVLVAIPAGMLQDASPRGSLWLVAAGLWLAVLCCWRLPETGSGAGARTGWGDLLRHPQLGALTLLASLHGVTLSTYDHLFSLLVHQRGLPDAVTGQGLALGVGAEVLVMLSAPWLLRVVGLRRMLVLAIASGVPRWLLTGADLGPAALVATQALHGVGFGAYWVSGVALFALHAPPGRSSSAQAMLVVATFGIGRMIAMALAWAGLGAVSVATWFSALSVVSAATAALGWRLLRGQGD
ncbi:MAG TPA: MFS transporter [Myxococcota bacterium]|nr:MFS transporter [Myxococcota bacterium]